MTEQLYVFIKRDLYENPAHMGYTGIRDKAGTWSREYAEQFADEIRERYSPSYMGHYALPFDSAPEFTNTSLHDLNEAHLKSKIEELRAANDNFREALTPSADTKRAYWGEFYFPITYTDEDGDERSYKQQVPWDTVKEIMATISERANRRAA
jgi:hypothetical protein